VTPSDVQTFFKRLKEANPSPQGELSSVNNYTLLVAVVLSAQATDKGVNKATKALFEKVTTPQEMLELGEEGLKEHIKTIGLFNSKARHIMGLSHLLVAQHNGDVPQTRAELMALPGVGRKTANVVLNTAFGHPTIAVDTHLFRVSNRTGLAPGKTPLEVEKTLLTVIPKEYLKDAHHWLILHGRYLCKAQKPLCEVCPVSDLCQKFNKTKHS
jgi:endonuclease-3